MKLNRETRIVGLSAILIVLITLISVCVGIFWGREQVDDVAGDKKPGKEVATDVERIYTDVPLEARTQNYWLDNYLLSYDDRPVVLPRYDIVDIVSGQKLGSYPKSDEENNIWWSCLYFDDNKSAGVIYFDIKINAVFFEQYSVTGELQGAAVELQEFNAEISNEVFVNINKMAMDDKYIYVEVQSEQRNLFVYNRDGTLHHTYEAITNFAIDEKGYIYIMAKNLTGGGAGFAKVKAESDTTEYVAEANDIYTKIFLNVQTNKVYLKSGKSIIAFDAADGKVIEEVFNQAEHADVIDLLSKTSGFLVDKDENIYLSQPIQKDGIPMYQYYMYKFEGTTGAQKNIAYTVTLSAPYKDDFITEAIALYEKANPDQKIKYDYAYQNWQEFGSNAAGDKYFERENMKTLAGESTDIIVNGSQLCDIYQRYNLDIYMDLAPMLSKDTSNEKLDDTILQSITIDGKIKGLPIATDYFYAHINTQLCREMGIKLNWNTAKWSDVLGLVDKFNGTDKYLFSMYDNNERAFVRMLISNMPDLINRETKKINLRQPWFLDLIEQWKEAAKSPNFALLNDSMGLGKNALISIDGRTSGQFNDDFIGAYVSDYEEYSKNYTAVPLFEGEKNANRTAASSCLLSISNRAENKDKAWDFLHFLVQENTQSLFAFTDVPLHLDARKAQQNEAMKRHNYNEDSVEKFQFDADNLYKSVDYLYDMNYMKEDLFRPLLKYLSGEITLDEALKRAERAIWIRLNE